ncbi:LysR family transcriptional regulator [Prauserella rugosa]|uniref:DNA-binding transcriptional LysR family regulator n=1 Tax=Prauserella rugosa TaxID=43354 RepID=A0A660CF18_9PSEU|nr:LysR substrate-binding domain-containing protein [Prauserella rugosa]KMS86038.1 LysR family transcriptional regulator [Streptomyces regensis]TWH22120.1 DNA-binding transcriptional LysR family regulator [Prauserella rugosa]
MQLQQLAYFLAVVETRQFTKAAEQMRVAQPSLSQQVRALERDVGAQLLHRVRGNVTLTEAGEALLPIARRIVGETENAYRAVRELDDLGRGRVRLGATPSLCTGVLPETLAAFRRSYPGIELFLHESGSRDLQTALSEGTLDLAMIIDSRERRPEPRIAARALFVEELVLISAKDAPPPVPGPRMSVAELAGCPLVMFRRGYDLRDTTVAACRSAGVEPTFAVEGGEMDAVLELVRAGVGVAVVPSTVVDDGFRITRFTAPGLTRTVRLASRRDVEPSRAVRALRDAVTGFLDEASRVRPLITVPVGKRA